MLDNEDNNTAAETPEAADEGASSEVPAVTAAEEPAQETPEVQPEAPSGESNEEPSEETDRAPARKSTARRSRRKPVSTDAAPASADAAATSEDGADSSTTPPAAPMVLFKAPETKPVRTRGGASAGTDSPEETAEASDATGGGAGRGTKGRRSDRAGESVDDAAADGPTGSDDDTSDTRDTNDTNDSDDGAEGGNRRRRRRGGRRRRKGAGEDSGDDAGEDTEADSDNGAEGDDSGASAKGDGSDDGADEGGTSRRRRRRRRSGDDGQDDSENNQKARSPEDEITGVTGSTRLEAKKQRRREGREAGRRRAPIVSEAEFLARRESVERVMVIRQQEDLTQIGVLEDDVLVEHYVSRESQTSLIGNVYLGRVQNVLPSMEAAFIDIGKGRNAVLYAGEVNWSALGHPDGQPRKIESVLSSGQTVLVQVTKDPIGHKGARLTGQISLPGRFLVYVPDGTTSGISRKLPDTERARLKRLLKEIVPDSAGVIVRTAAEGASEEELTRDVERLTARWSDIEGKVKAGKSPQLLYGEPDLTLKVVRDLFTEDFARLVVQGDDAWDLVDGYVTHVAPDLRERLERFEPATEGSDAGKDLFAAFRVDEQIAKGLDRKVWLPSGGSLVIDRTEAMTVVDVNTGKFTGSGGNLEETVTKNNLEAAEEIVRQLRLRDIGGIIVVDFIDMVLESNRDLVLRRLVECLGRDRTRHQVAEVTSLGLVQMTRKRIGTGLLEAFSNECEHCKGRGVVVHDHPVEPSSRGEDDGRGRRGRGGRGGRSGRGGSGNGSSGDDRSARRPEKRSEKHPDKQSEEQAGDGRPAAPTPADLAGTKPPENLPDGGEDQVLEGPRGDAAVEPQQVPSAQGSEPEPEPSPEPPSAPRVTTSSRRRGARRPAGPPVGMTGSASSADDEPVAVPVEPGESAAGSGSDSRTDPGPDSGPDSGLDPGPDSELEPGEDSAEPGLLHVPVKKKGSRKR